MRSAFNSDSDLLTSFQSGEDKGFSRVFQKYYPALCYFANRFHPNRQWAEDIVQEVFLNLWNRREEFDKIEAIHSYLFRATANQCINSLKKEQIQRDKLNDAVMQDITESEMFDSIIRAEMHSKIYSIIEELPKPFAEVIELYYLEQKGIHEIAEILGIPVFTVKSRRQRAIIKLRKLLPGYFRTIILLLTLTIY